jgi:hypothetical protein
LLAKVFAYNRTTDDCGMLHHMTPRKKLPIQFGEPHNDLIQQSAKKEENFGPEIIQINTVENCHKMYKYSMPTWLIFFRNIPAVLHLFTHIYGRMTTFIINVNNTQPVKRYNKYKQIILCIFPTHTNRAPEWHRPYFFTSKLWNSR